MSDTPDLDRMTEAALKLIRQELPVPLDSLVAFGLEQRAEEVELQGCPFCKREERAQHLRAQIGGAKS